MGLALPLLIAGGGAMALSGVPGLFLPWRSPAGPRLAAGASVLGALLGAAGAVLALAGDGAGVLTLPSPIPGARIALAADALTGAFALPAFVVGALGALYGLAYWPPAARPRNGRRLRFAYGTLLGAIVFVTLARDAVGFLVAWEAMALSGYFLVTTDARSAATREAGWLYLVFSHAGTLCLVGFFAVLAGLAGGGPAWTALAAGGVGRGTATLLFALALAGFGIKAGLVPLHSWLPAAHAAAPSHVSAVMSGVMLKAGIYGLVRATSLLPPPPPSWGAAVLVAGGVSCVLGIVFALAQRDLKRLLAYSSVENVGIAVLGFGLALVGRAVGRPDWVLLGLGGCVFHVWSHALMKSLLFLGAGAVTHATGTRDLERLGGLARRMPATAALFVVGAVAIAGLPPLAGFVGELLVVLGLARAGMTPGAAWVALPAPALAAAGALAVACFVKVVGVAFLGTPRSDAASRAHETPRLMLAPMAALAAGCVALGVAPGVVAPALERVAVAWAGAPLPGPGLAALAPFGAISAGAVGLTVATAGGLVALVPVCRRARRRQPTLPTWDCGYAGASPRLQYTASSFAQLVTARFAWALRPEVEAPGVTAPGVATLFPAPARYVTRVGDAVLERLVLPAARRLQAAAGRVRVYQQGNLQRYVLYVLAAIALLLAANLRPARW